MPELDQASINLLRDMAAWWKANKANVNRPDRARPRLMAAAAGSLYIAKVVSDATGGGYYNCYLQTLDATYWNTNTTILQNPTPLESVIVLNLAEVGATDVWNLAANDLIICWKAADDEGNIRYIGYEINGRHTFGEWI